jgi:glycosyltransferase involved in cell wall biosynthesis
MSPIDESPRQMTRVLHVAESFASGVASAILDYAGNTPSIEHHLLYATRQDAPIATEAVQSFATSVRLPDGHHRRIASVRKRALSIGADVIHAHSSFAGIYARLAAVTMPGVKVVYTPHCFAFERLDTSRAARAAIYVIEKALSLRTDVVAGCSEREVELARGLNPRVPAVYLPNALPSYGPPAAIATKPRLKIAAAGRMGPQKDPEFFAQIASAALREMDDVDFVWLGGGTDIQTAQLSSDGITVTGWLTREEVLEQLRTCDVYVHTARWEGYPLGILEATAAGVPTIVRTTDSTKHFPASTRFASPAEAVGHIEAFRRSDARTRAIGVWDRYTSVNTAEKQRSILEELYTVRSRSPKVSKANQ